MDNETENISLEVRDLEPKLNEELMKYFLGFHSGFVRVGPKGYIFSKNYEKAAAEIYNISVRPSDIWVVTCPRSGTTWVQELVWLVANDLDYAKASEIPIGQRFPFFEMWAVLDYRKDNILVNEERLGPIKSMLRPDFDAVNQMPSPRFIKSHLPLSLLPPPLIDTAKVVYVTRDPRDIAVSFYHHNRLIKFHDYVGDFKTYWNFFINDLILYTPIFENIKEAWEKRNYPNMLFLFYEELSKDLPGVVQRVCAFLGKQLTESQIEHLCHHLSFDNFKNNKSVNLQSFEALGLTKSGEEPFIRKGKTGGWREYFDEEMTKQADQWMEENLRNTDLRFPQ